MRVLPEGGAADDEVDFCLPKTLRCWPEVNLSKENPLRGPSSKDSIVEATKESSK